MTLNCNVETFKSTYCNNFTYKTTLYLTLVETDPVTHSGHEQSFGVPNGGIQQQNKYHHKMDANALRATNYQKI